MLKHHKKTFSARNYHVISYSLIFIEKPSIYDIIHFVEYGVLRNERMGLMCFGMWLDVNRAMLVNLLAH